MSMREVPIQRPAQAPASDEISYEELLRRATAPGGALESVQAEVIAEREAEAKAVAATTAKQEKAATAALDTTREAAREARDKHFGWAEAGIPLVEEYVSTFRAYKTAERECRRLGLPLGEPVMDFGMMAHAADSKTEEGRALRSRVRRVAEALSWGIFS